VLAILERDQGWYRGPRLPPLKRRIVRSVLVDTGAEWSWLRDEPVTRQLVDAGPAPGSKCPNDVGGHPAPGSVVWQVRGQGLGIPAFDDAGVYFPGYRHDLTAIEKHTGEVRWRQDMPWVDTLKPRSSICRMKRRFRDPRLDGRGRLAEMTRHDYHVTMKNTVGIAELKSRLSEYLRRVRRGQSLTVVDRDTPVARLEPVGNTGSGVIIRPPAPGAPRPGAVRLPPPLKLKSDILRLLSAERGAR